MRSFLFFCSALAAAVPASADVYDKLAKRLVREVEGAAGAKAAVLPFSYADGRSSPGGTIVSEALSTAIAERARDLLVERSQLESAMKEISLAYTGAISSATALQAGRLTGARFLILGTLADEGEREVQIHARLIETESGVVRTAAKATTRKTWRDVAPLEGGGRKPLSVTTAQLPTGGPAGLRLESFGDRRLLLEYLNTDGRPQLRLTDVTDPKKPDADSVELPLNAEKNTFSTLKGTRVKLKGRRYLIWSGVWKPEAGPTLHIAPLKGFWTDATEADQEVLVGFADLTERWVREVQARGHFLGPRDGLDLVAYFERLPRARVRVSVWEIDGQRNLARTPARHLVVEGRKGGEVATPITEVGTRHFRFKYDLDQDRLTVEEP